MATTKQFARKETVKVSRPPVVKRERSDDDDEEEGWRRVVTRRTAAAAADNVKEYIKTIGRSDNEDLLTDVMEKLAKCLFDENTHIVKQEMFLRVGGPATVVRTMEKHPDCKLLQQHGFVVIMNATWNNKELAAVVVDVEGVQAIVAAMNRFPLSQGIQIDGLKTLFNLTWHSPHAETFVLKMGGLAQVIKVMRTFHDSVDIVLQACRVLSNLSKIETLKKPMRDTGVVSALATAIDGHKENEGIQSWAWKVMKSL